MFAPRRVELFWVESGPVILNEIAPRPHNSGHYTMNGCQTSQFEQHLRAILGWPLGDPNLSVGCTVMYNLLGEEDGEEGLKRAQAVLARARSLRGAHVHWYGKEDIRKKRKVCTNSFLWAVFDGYGLSCAGNRRGGGDSVARKGKDCSLGHLKKCKALIGARFQINRRRAHMASGCNYPWTVTHGSLPIFVSYFRNFLMKKMQNETGCNIVSFSACSAVS